jgi:isoleucyl-tRNA synthetase
MPSPVFEKVPSELNFPKEERETLAFWKNERIFERSLAGTEGVSANGAAPTFVFYEGPPTANGLPHNGHVLTRVIKDLFPRYKTMRGYRVPRKAGWDTHGLPVEVEVEKELRIHGKAAIEEYGVEPFIRKCVDSVFRYTKEWEELTERVAFWCDLESAYVTYHKSYVESVWWALSKLFEKGLLYQGHKVVWWWAQGGTALSSGEVGQGYRQVDDPSVFVAFPLVGDAELSDASLLVWTTTPWTLPSNMYAAVNTKYEYVVVEAHGRRYVVASDLVGGLAKKLGCDLPIERSIRGADLVGKRYAPPFDLYRSQATGPIWSVIAADFVTLDAGTGIVHIAPAFGEDDHGAHRKLLAENPGLPLFCAVKPDGTFVPELARYAGRWVKDCDKEIQHELKERHLLVHAELYRHDYPFCWRADDDPLIQFARPAWYIRTTALIDNAIANNRQVQWLPEHIKEGRFGDFLANNVDWALSRERYWGTPLNVWVCSKDVEHKHCPSSVAAIEAMNPRAFDHFRAAKAADPTLNDHLVVHKPWIDAVTFPCPTCGAEMRRVPEVIDCWFDSGCMPFAQWGWPHTGEREFKESFPADFISEAIDQTRGWFYSLLMISTLVFPEQKLPHPFKTCIVLGHVSDKEGKKESKSKGNYTPPEVILDDVAMEFAVVHPEAAHQFKGVTFKPVKDLARGVAWIAREDLEGLDLVEPAKVELCAAGGAPRKFELHVQKNLPRRVIVLHPDDAKELGATPTKSIDVKPVEVPRLPATERVLVRDTSSPAPGADAFRWFFYAASPPWSATRHSLSNVRALQKEFAVKLRNVYSFFTIYANIDGFDPEARAARGEPKNELDRWITGELAKTVAAVTRDLDAYDVYDATQELTAFVDALSNWYVRRSRARFWRSGALDQDEDKRHAYGTLYDALVTLAKLTAPFVPFGAERMYRNLVVGPAKRAGREVPASVHLCAFPAARGAVDEALSKKVRAVRDLVSLGLQVRTHAKIKVRQPLHAANVVVAHPELLDASALAMLKEELNVLATNVYGPRDASRFVEYKLKPNFRTLGQKGLGKQAQELKKKMGAMSSADAAALASRLIESGKETFDGIELERADVEIEFISKEGFAAAGDRAGVVVLETKLDDRLRELGFARELQNRVQTMRKEMALDFADRIKLAVIGSERVDKIVDATRDELCGEVLAVELSTTTPPHGATSREVDVEGEKVTIAIARA